MAYLDKQNQFSAAQAVVNTGSTPSTNVIDLGVARDIGGAVTDNLYLLCEVVTAFTSGGSATLQVQFQGSTDNASWATIVQTDTIAVASLVQGYKFLQGPPMSMVASTLYRYLRLNYVVGTAAMTAGNISAAFTPSLQHSPVYAAGYVA
jgi:hypothetical protein